MKYVDLSTKKKVPPKTPQEEDETSVSGHMPDPESDDNTDEVVAEVGLYADQDEYNQPVDVAEEVREAEENRREPTS